MAVDRRVLFPDPADRSLRCAVAAIGQLVAGCRYGWQRGNRAAHLARPVGLRWTCGGALPPCARGHAPHLDQPGGCPGVLGRATPDLPVEIPSSFPIPAARSTMGCPESLSHRYF